MSAVAASLLTGILSLFTQSTAIADMVKVNELRKETQVSYPSILAYLHSGDLLISKSSTETPLVNIEG